MRLSQETVDPDGTTSEEIDDENDNFIVHDESGANAEQPPFNLWQKLAELDELDIDHRKEAIKKCSKMRKRKRIAIMTEDDGEVLEEPSAQKDSDVIPQERSEPFVETEVTHETDPGRAVKKKLEPPVKVEPCLILSKVSLEVSVRASVKTRSKPRSRNTSKLSNKRLKRGSVHKSKRTRKKTEKKTEKKKKTSKMQKAIVIPGKFHDIRSFFVKR